MNSKRTIIGFVIAAVIAVASLAYAQPQLVKNYFSRCNTSGAGCDNVLNITGSFKVNTITAKPASGQLTNASASDTVITGLATVRQCVAVLDSDLTTDPESATCSIGDQAGTPAAGSILIKTWKTLGGTPVAATTFSKKVNWSATGT